MGYIKSILKKVIPSGIRRTLRVIQEEWQFALQQTYFRIFKKNELGKITGTHLLLNVGCGKELKEGWVNIDLIPCKGVYYADVARRLPLKEGAFRHIHCEHLLEHLDYEQAKGFLNECLRILEKDGCLRLILPDAEKYLRAYCQNDRAFFDSLDYLGGKPFRTTMEVINQVFRMGGAHKFAWDMETLLMILTETGFTRVVKSRLGDVAPDLNIDLTDYWRPIESLYVNAYK